MSAGVGVWLPHLLVGLAAAGLIGVQNRSMARRRPDWPTLRRTTPAAARGRRLRSVLTGYVVRRYLLMTLLAFGGLFVGYLLVDVLERLDWFARYRATPAEALRFYGARAPLLAARVVPMALLLAAALTVSVLSHHRELIAMRACGIAAERGLACILAVAGLAVPLSFALHEYVVPRTNAAADRLKITRIKDRALPTGVLRKIVWYRGGQPRVAGHTTRSATRQRDRRVGVRTGGRRIAGQSDRRPPRHPRGRRRVGTGRAGPHPHRGHRAAPRAGRAADPPGPGPGRQPGHHASRRPATRPGNRRGRGRGLRRDDLPGRLPRQTGPPAGVSGAPSRPALLRIAWPAVPRPRADGCWVASCSAWATSCSPGCAPRSATAAPCLPRSRAGRRR